MKSAYAFATIGLMMLSGCYSLEPVSTIQPTQKPNQRVAFDVTDAGRVALGGSMGPEIDQIEGVLNRMDSSSYTVSVTTVRFLRGGEQRWTGEPVRIGRDYISRSYVRTFDSGKTVLASGLGIGAIALVIGRSVIGGGNIETEIGDTTKNPGGNARRIPIPPIGRIIHLQPAARYSPLWFPPHLSRP